MHDLLAEAQGLVERANRDAALRHRELAERTRALEDNVREMEALLVRTERQAAQLANLYASRLARFTSRSANCKLARERDALVALGALGTNQDGNALAATTRGVALRLDATNAIVRSIMDGHALTLGYGRRGASSIARERTRGTARASAPRIGKGND